MFKLVLLLLSLLLQTTFAQDDCHGSYCYRLFVEKENWQGAMTKCKDMGGQLAEPRSAAIDTVLQNMVRRSDSSCSFTWLGGYKAVLQWRWLSDRSLFSYTNWPPNPWYNGPGCLYLNVDSGKWNQDRMPCLREECFICQIMDVNECEENPCGIHKCVNNQGSYMCICNSGYVKEGGKCIDVDECTNKPCGIHQCTNLEGSFKCTCNEGFIMKDGKCQDLVSGTTTTTPTTTTTTLPATITTPTPTTTTPTTTSTTTRTIPPATPDDTSIEQPTIGGLENGLDAAKVSVNLRAEILRAYETDRNAFGLRWWQSPCCPRSQSHQCRTNYAVYPWVIYYWQNWQRYLCYIRGNQVKYGSSCTCSKCLRYSSNGCWSTGKCRMRYKSVVLTAYCFPVNTPWPMPRWMEITRRMGDHCYCSVPTVATIFNSFTNSKK